MTEVRRSIVVGIAAAAVLLVLISASSWLEMRYTKAGNFMRDSAVEMQKQDFSRDYFAKYGDPTDFLGRWLRLNMFVVQPGLCLLIGICIGRFTTHIVIASLIGVAPIISMYGLLPLINALTAGSMMACLLACWSSARVTRLVLERPPRPLAIAE